jgi:hypothetical protein
MIITRLLADNVDINFDNSSEDDAVPVVLEEAAVSPHQESTQKEVHTPGEVCSCRNCGLFDEDSQHESCRSVSGRQHAFRHAFEMGARVT